MDNLDYEEVKFRNSWQQRNSSQQTKGEYQKSTQPQTAQGQDFLDKIYKNAGAKMRLITKIILALELIGGIGTGIAFISTGYDDDILLGIVILLATPLVAYFLSFLNYCFTELLENVAIIAKNTAPKVQEEITQETK